MYEKNLNPIIISQSIIINLIPKKLIILSNYCYSINYCQNNISQNNIIYDNEEEERGSVTQRSSGELFIFEDSVVSVPGFKIGFGLHSFSDPLGHQTEIPQNR